VGRIETAKEKIIYLEEIETKLKAQPTQKKNQIIKNKNFS